MRGHVQCAKWNGRVLIFVRLFERSSLVEFVLVIFCVGLQAAGGQRGAGWGPFYRWCKRGGHFAYFFACAPLTIKLNQCCSRVLAARSCASLPLRPTLLAFLAVLLRCHLPRALRALNRRAIPLVLASAAGYPGVCNLPAVSGRGGAVLPDALRRGAVGAGAGRRWEAGQGGQGTQSPAALMICARAGEANARCAT